MATLQVMEAANLFAGSADPNASNHLALTELKLPGFEEAFADHIAGGAPVALRIDTHVNPLDATFNLLGYSTQVMKLFHSWVRSNHQFTARGLIRDRATGAAKPAVAVMWGRLSRVNPANWQKNNLHHHEYAINGIQHYELSVGSERVYYWDFFTNELVIGDVDRNREMNQILGIEGGGLAATGFETGGSLFQGNSTAGSGATTAV